jgi:hypothetical protein
MSKRWGKSAAKEDEPPEAPPATAFPVKCSGENCLERTTFLLPGDSPYEVGYFLRPGWTTVAGDDPPGLAFLCRACFDRELQEGRVRSAPLGGQG